MPMPQLKEYVTARVSVETRRQIEEIAQTEERTVSSVVTRLLRAALEAYAKNSKTQKEKK